MENIRLGYIGVLCSKINIVYETEFKNNETDRKEVVQMIRNTMKFINDENITGLDERVAQKMKEIDNEINKREISFPEFDTEEGFNRILREQKLLK